MEAITAIRDAAQEAVANERAEIIAICRAMKSEHWTPEKADGLDGLDRMDYYDHACADIERAIRERGEK